VEREIRSDSSVMGLNWSPANATVAVTVTLFFLVFLWLYFFVTGQPPTA
jgi:hypothetical protein